MEEIKSYLQSEETGQLNKDINRSRFSNIIGKHVLNDRYL